MNFSRDDLIAFQEENDRIFSEISESKNLDALDQITTGFMNRLSQSFEQLEKVKATMN